MSVLPRTSTYSSNNDRTSNGASAHSRSRSPSRNLGPRSSSRNQSSRSLSQDRSPRSPDRENLGPRSGSRLSSPPLRSPYSSFSPLGSSNYFPLRTSSTPVRSTVRTPVRYPMDLYDRNAAAVGYILDNDGGNYTKALTTAVENVVSDYFR